MVQKARREKRYACCSRIVPKKMNLKFDLLWESYSNQHLSVNEQLVHKWTSNIGLFDGFWDH
jgi:hypothetical protein